MKQIALILFWALPFPAFSQSESKDALTEQLFETREPAAFEAIYKKAEKEGVIKQALIEARFLFLVDTQNNAALGAYSKTLEAHLPHFKATDSSIFAVREDYQAIIEYTKALAALEKNDTEGFKKHIKEAFWLSPSQAPVFGRHIDNIRLKTTMARLKFDFSRKLPSQKKGEETKDLKTHLGDAPAMLLHFWSPWAQESIESMADFFVTTSELQKHKVPVVSVLVSGNAESRKVADEFLTEQGDKATGLWLVDTQKGALASTLRLQAFPTVVLVTKDGTILFNGHPASHDFWAKIKDLVPQAKRPDAPGR